MKRWLSGRRRQAVNLLGNSHWFESNPFQKMYPKQRKHTYINIKYKHSFNGLITSLNLFNSSVIPNKYFNVQKKIKVLSTFTNLNSTVFRYNKSDSFNLNYLLSFNFKRRRFFPSLRTILHTNLFYVSLGIFFSFFKKKKSFLKSKLMYIILISFLRKILLFSHISLFIMEIKYVPKYLMEILNALLEPTQKFYQNPFKSNLLVNELEWRPTFTFYATIFNYKSNPKLIKLPQKGRLKRKITKKVLLLNNILD